jgi:signal transduction histidine kinase
MIREISSVSIRIFYPMKPSENMLNGKQYSQVAATNEILETIRSGAMQMEDSSDFKGIAELLLRSRKREVLIEEALEKVRVSTLAMRRSEQLPETAEVLFKQFGLLGEIPDRMSIGIIDEETRMVKLWVTDQHGNQLNHVFYFSLAEPTSIAKIYKAWRQRQESIVVDLTGSELETWLQFVKQVARLPIDESQIHGRRVQQAAFFSQGFLLITTHEPITPDMMQLLVRFARVYDMIYTRFLDLQMAEERAKESYEAKQRIEAALNELRATQAQLIQSEKMASLGELTAGIAHEIQNPLNFVNNFSEVNEELIAEIKQAIEKGNSAEAQLLADAIGENEKKINTHGRRADAIVKIMMQHSKRSTGRKTSTDINALAEEFLQLAYNGIRARDSSFQANLNYDFDPAAGKIDIYPQDLGMVFLNLFNNAFYAMSEKKNEGIEGYEPVIAVSTKKKRNTLEIHVQDNGNGIPEKLKTKIFQPFFTTKPAGEGIGLGLSLSYDVVKMHGGELRLRSRPREGAEFILQLPLKSEN